MLQPASAESPGVTPPVGAHGVATQDIAEIRNMIIGQIAAFREDDAEPGRRCRKGFFVRRPGNPENLPHAGNVPLLRTPEMFLYMVRKSYQAVYRPRKYEFRTIRNIDGKVVQPVTIVGPTGVTETALYIMEKQPDGTWRIGACIMAREPGSET